MRSNANTGSNMSKLVLEGMMTIFIVLIFLFIVQNWVLTNTGNALFVPTCSLTENRVEIGGPAYKSKNIIDDYKLCKIKFDNM